MSKKLLSEAQVRRFQSLASIKPLQEMGDYSMKRDEEEPMEEMAYKKHDDEDKMEEASDEAAMKDDEKMESLYEEEDEEQEEDMGDADVELDEDLVQQFMDAVKTIEQVADTLRGAAGGEEDMDMGGDDMEMDMGGDDLPAPEAKDEASPEGEEMLEEDEEMLEEALRGISYVPSQKEIVSTVAKRVAKRLQEAKRAEAKLNRALGKK